MSKIANKRPEAKKVPVYVTESKYELWHTVPVCLGTITKKNNAWHTADGMRFLNSREALDYLIRIGAQPVAPVAVEQKPLVPITVPATEPGPANQAVVPAATETSVQAPATTRVRAGIAARTGKKPAAPTQSATRRSGAELAEARRELFREFLEYFGEKQRTRTSTTSVRKSAHSA